MTLPLGTTRPLDAVAGGSSPSSSASRAAIVWASGLAALAFLVYHLSVSEPTPFDHYVRLADAFLHGRLDLVDPPPYLEVTTFEGRHYMMPPPFPALLMLPYVAVAGPAANQSLVSHVVGALSASP